MKHIIAIFVVFSFSFSLSSYKTGLYHSKELNKGMRVKQGSFGVISTKVEWKKASSSTPFYIDFYFTLNEKYRKKCNQIAVSDNLKENYDEYTKYINWQKNGFPLGYDTFLLSVPLNDILEDQTLYLNLFNIKGAKVKKLGTETIKFNLTKDEIAKYYFPKLTRWFHSSAFGNYKVDDFLKTFNSLLQIKDGYFLNLDSVKYFISLYIEDNKSSEDEDDGIKFPPMSHLKYILFDLKYCQINEDKGLQEYIDAQILKYGMEVFSEREPKIRNKDYDDYLDYIHPINWQTGKELNSSEIKNNIKQTFNNMCKIVSVLEKELLNAKISSNGYETEISQIINDFTEYSKTVQKLISQSLESGDLTESESTEILNIYFTHYKLMLENVVK